ncbi:MAG: alpha-glucosidase [Burkholderiales bacterium]
MSKWWRKRVVYQIYPRSFADTNGDGFGDIPGIIEHLDYLKDLGIGIIWLGPVYRSPDADNGYDISDYRDIDPKYGTMADMDRLIEESGRRDIRIVMDLVINHTSDEHPWFKASRDKSSPYRDYYIWRPGRDGRPPNNWISLFGGSAWEYDEQSGEYYLHLFAKKQPDLNYRNPKVLEEIKDIMRFWLDRGVSGFRCDVINIIWKSSLEDSKKLIIKGSEYYTSQPGAHEILKTLRSEVLSRYDCFTVGEAVFVTTQMGRDLTDESRGELDMIFSFEHMETDQYFIKWFKRRFNAGQFGKIIAKWQNALEWNACYLENHDQPRSVSRFGDDGEYWAVSAKMLCLMLLTLRGTPFIYQGQEIGMTNFDFTGMDQIKDVESLNIYNTAKKLHIPAFYRWRMIKRSSRDNSRTPMQWSAEPGAGFTAGEPWLSINKNHKFINAAAQINDPDSVLSFYKKMIALRANSDVLVSGEFRLIRASGSLFIYEREKNGQVYRVLLNFGKRTKKAAADGKVIISNYDSTEYDGSLKPYEAVLLDVTR